MFYKFVWNSYYYIGGYSEFCFIFGDVVILYCYSCISFFDCLFDILLYLKK